MQASLTVGGCGGGGGGGCGCKEVPADRAQADQGVGKAPRPISTCKTESGIQLLIQENSKPQDLIVYSDCPVTKDQTKCGITAKQGTTTIHKNSATCTVSASSLTMDLQEAVTQEWKDEAVDDFP